MNKVIIWWVLLLVGACEDRGHINQENQKTLRQPLGDELNVEVYLFINNLREQ